MDSQQPSKCLQKSLHSFVHSMLMPLSVRLIVATSLPSHTILQFFIIDHLHSIVYPILAYKLIGYPITSIYIGYPILFMKCCGMKGFLSYLVLWILSKNSLSGAGISKELDRRRGCKPSPGTIYPVLKELKANGLITADKNKVYSLTKEGKKELKSTCECFCKIFYDVEEMRKCHKC